MFRRVAENLWELERPLKAPGLRVGHRMTVVRLANDELWVHSPVHFEERIASELRDLGAPRYFIAPSTFHDLHWPEWFANFREATFCCAPGVKEEHVDLPFQRVLNEAVKEPWEDELPKQLLRGMPKLNEFVFLHRPTRTLIVADLLFNFDVNQQSMLGKLFLKLNGIYGHAGCSRVFRRYIKQHVDFRASIEELLRWDFDRIILGHGAIISRDGKRVFENAMAKVLSSRKSE